ncbi:12083_t:CDS:10 [Ambispora gerdemannii]|uniref:12083_t:CDS:1 n=1 Tax=Ambispora gerdemannii TaxID=144530 RepID=A0A9N8YXT7_9GLOM|nr:12083_t:CDS:10 [Ambispora gerdemannii]
MAILNNSNTPIVNFGKIPYKRPWFRHRKFKSRAVEQAINDVVKKMKDRDLAVLFENCWSKSLDDYVLWQDDSKGYPRTFIVPGKFEVLFIRDSTNQVISYTPFAKDDPELAKMILGVINIQAEYLAKDIYSNSFFPPLSSDLPRPYDPWEENDKSYPKPSSAVWQEKFGADNLAAFLKLTYHYWKNTNDSSFLQNEHWVDAMQFAVNVFSEQMRGTMEEFGNEAYLFTRPSRNSSETLLLDGRGAIAKRTGLVKSHFRPSDDASFYPFIIPTNAMISMELLHLKEILDNSDPDTLFHTLDLSSYILNLSREIREAIYKHAVVKHETLGEIMTSDNDTEILENLELLKDVGAHTGYLSQAFWFHDSAEQLRSEFGAANSLFGEAILRLARDRPHVVFDVPPPPSPAPSPAPSTLEHPIISPLGQTSLLTFFIKMASKKTQKLADKAQYIKGVAKEKLGRTIHDEKLVADGTNETLTKQAEMEAAQKVAVNESQKNESTSKNKKDINDDKKPFIVSLKKRNPKVVEKPLTKGSDNESPAKEHGKANPVTHQKMNEIDPMEPESSKLKKEKSKL